MTFEMANLKEFNENRDDFDDLLGEAWFNDEYLIEQQERETENLVSELYKESHRDCGGHFECFLNRFRDLMISRFGNNEEIDPVTSFAFEIARRKYDYPAKNSGVEDHVEIGVCPHGIDPEYCPRGCGEVMRFDTEKQRMEYYE